ncbi:MAG: ribosome maturation factor RimP [Anaerovoracaceae bacterium]
MAKKKVTVLAEELLGGFLEKEGYELYSSEFVKEGKDWFLRIYIDKPEGEGYIGTEDCEKVSRFLSEKLDEEDAVEQNYFLEVSSPGMDKELIRPEHYRRYTGHQVEVRLYKSLDGVKNINGTLDGLEGDTVTITDENGKKWDLDFNDIARTKLAVIF